MAWRIVSEARFDLMLSDMSRCSRRILIPERLGLCCEIEGPGDDVVRYVSGLFSEVHRMLSMGAWSDNNLGSLMKDCP